MITLQILDVWFADGNKRRFYDVAKMETRGNWMVLTNWQGGEILINSGSVNFIEDMTEYGGGNTDEMQAGGIKEKDNRCFKGR